MWTLKPEYDATYPGLVGISAEDALVVLSFRGGWISEGHEGKDENIFTDKFEFIEA